MKKRRQNLTERFANKYTNNQKTSKMFQPSIKKKIIELRKTFKKIQ